MNAIRIHGKEDVRLEQISRPEPRPDEVLLQITGAGLCGTDAALFRHGSKIVPPGSVPEWPIVLGHEFAGRVVEAGSEVHTLTVGDVVASGAGVSCGECFQCAESRTNLCEKYWTAGVHRDGGLAEYCAVPASICEPTERFGVDDDAAALAQPMAIAVHAVDRGRPQAGERVLILGAGGIGAFATWVASRAGAEVTAFDRDEQRLAVAESLGAEHAVRSEVGRTTLETLSELGPWDVVYEMTGGPDPLKAAVALVRPGGRLVVAGIQTAEAEVDMARLSLQEVEVSGTMAHVRALDLPRALALLADREDGWSDVVGEVSTLAEIVEVGLPALVRGDAMQTKLFADPSSSASRRFGG